MHARNTDGVGDNMLQRIDQFEPQAAEPFDICIIGAGAAGLTLAQRLDQSLRVCLLESGHKDPSNETQVLNAASSSGLEYDLEESRARALGGTLHTWQGTIAPLDPIDFEPREWIAHSGWPIRANELSAGYAEAYRVLNVEDIASGFDGLSADRQAEIDAFGAPMDTFRAKPFIMMKMQLEGLCRRLRDEAAGRANVTCVTNATVVELSPQEGQDGLISYVRVKSADGQLEKHVHAKRFVVCTGGLEAPRLLLASRTRAPSGLGNDHDLVGRFFMDHPRVRSSAISLPRALTAPILRHVTLKRCGYKAGLILHDHIQREHRLPNYNIFLTNVGVDLERQAAKLLASKDEGGQTSATPKPKNVKSARIRTVQAARRMWRSMPVRMRVAVESAMSQRAFNNLAFVLKMEQVPNPSSRITLTDERDRLGAPKLNLDWRLAEDDHRMLRDFLDLLRRSFAAQGFASDGVDFLNPDGSMTFQDSSHPTGTTRMSDSPQTGVVDHNLQVFGTHNVFICSSSCFPTGGNANPTLTIMALSCRLAEHLNAEAARRPAVHAASPEANESTQAAV